LDGVLDRHKQGLDVPRQRTAPHHSRPDFYRRIRNERPTQANISEVVVEVRPASAVQRVTRCSNSWATFAPRTGAAEISPALVGEKHIRPMLGPLKFTLQPACAACQGHQIRVVGDRDQEVDVFGRLASR
jgi:hypothetical protein